MFGMYILRVRIIQFAKLGNMGLCRSFRKTLHSRGHSVEIPPFDDLKQNFNSQMQVQSSEFDKYSAWT